MVIWSMWPFFSCLSCIFWSLNILVNTHAYKCAPNFHDASKVKKLLQYFSSKIEITPIKIMFINIFVWRVQYLDFCEVVPKFECVNNY